ncbi:MAG: DUF87 domain-containing protein [Prevotella sp.]|jgi:hypothetical protein|nr:DUF87 domain-containing protein [Prevotella sp.]
MIPNETALLDNLGKIAYTLDRAYMARLEDEYDVVPFKGDVDYPTNIRALQVKRWVYDKDEKISDCFKNVLSVFAGSGNTIALVLKRTPEMTEIYFVIKNTGGGKNEDSLNNVGLLADSLRGNFPGSEIQEIEEKNDGKDTEGKFDFHRMKSSAILCNIPSEKSKDYICQGIDKLLNGIVPKSDNESYYVVIMAEALSQVTLRDILSGYEELATAITPFAGYQFQMGKNKTETTGEMESLSHAEGVSESISKTHSLHAGIHVGIRAIGGVMGYGYSRGKTHAENTLKTATKGTNRNLSLGTSENTTYTYKSYLVSDLIAMLEVTIKRITESQSTGFWKCASYILAPEIKISKNIANFLRSITQGDESFIEPAVIQAWGHIESNGVVPFNEILNYLRLFCHPVLCNKKDGTPVSPTVNVSTKELSNMFAFPRYSVQGIPVMQCARFGLEPHSLVELENGLEIGSAYHMRKTFPAENPNRISLNKDELTKHTFITGSTGSGKSNAIYKLLEVLCPQCSENVQNKNKTTFLVVEPAKGEYKDFFGGREDVAVYGTNPFKTPNLLAINPFSFPPGVHVLEHIDRLGEVFNACWPMYAAMPAILKESVEKAYEETGWNLKLSINPGVYPTFDTLLQILPKVVDSSAYSADTSNDYKGALITRIRSLTRGIHGLVFSNDIAPEEIFTKNAIVDISRIGSQETKALIMGVLVLKLQEFRISEETPPNGTLRHITVLEEAHNLLRRTSNEQSQESSNLQGKSVEMLANAIAEMRTYGEGFIIADQSPGLLDMAVIRNTNTKIILRLPDEDDRMLVGKSAGLNDSQVEELSRLEIGVAAISQSNWFEPVLCKIDKFCDEHPLNHRYPKEALKEWQNWKDEESKAINEFLCVAFDVEKKALTKDAADKIRKWYAGLELSKKSCWIIEKVLEGEPINDSQKMLLIYYIADVQKLDKITDCADAVKEIETAFKSKYGVPSDMSDRISVFFSTHFPIVMENSTKQIEQIDNGDRIL